MCELMRYRRSLCLLASLALVFLFCGVAAADITFQGTAQTDDNLLYSSADGVYNLGANVEISAGADWTGSRRSLLRFDLSSLAGKTVTAVSLTLAKTSDSGNSYSQPVNLYQISSANAGWDEGASAYAAAKSGESCWAAKVYPSTPWAGSAGLGTAGTADTKDTDYIATPLGSFTVANTDAVGTLYTVNFASVSFLQDWVNTPASNAGFLLYSPALETASAWIAFGSSENATAGYQPVLTVTVVPEPCMLALLATGLFGLICYAWRKRK